MTGSRVFDILVRFSLFVLFFFFRGAGPRGGCGAGIGHGAL